ncbi:MAG: hypothetical protein WEG40_14175 [Candidatus Rokuibacteriota bacterium]
MRSRAFALVLILVMGTAPAIAWEDDVHFGLTKWLALQAGYSDKAAHDIASNNVESDEGILDARKLVFWYACLGREKGKGASLIAKDLHFPSGGDVPGSAAERTVRPGDKWAFRETGIQIERSVQPDERADSIRRFGQGIHALQDSWSHQGEPEIPPGCSETLAWGHPNKRGGWLKHRADLTVEWPTDIRATVEATWKVLEAYAKRNPWVRAQSRQPVPLSALKADVTAFGAAGTKTDKLRWFVDRGFDEPAIIPYLLRTSLADGKRQMSTPSMPMVAALATGPIVALGPVPADAGAHLVEFWNRWVSGRDFYGLATRSLAVREFAQNVGVQGRPDDIAAATLGLWRLADHGQVERLGHVPPVPGTQAESELRALLKDPAATIAVDGLAYAMSPLAVKGPPLALAPVGRNRYAAIGRFRHAPHDVVMAVTERIGRDWKITEIRSMVEH